MGSGGVESFVLNLSGKFGAAFFRKWLPDWDYVIDEGTANYLSRLENEDQEDQEESEKSDKCSRSTTRMESVINSEQGCSSSGHGGQEQTR